MKEKAGKRTRGKEKRKRRKERRKKERRSSERISNSPRVTQRLGRNGEESTVAISPFTAR